MLEDVAGKQYYHVAGSNYEAGMPILCWVWLHARGWNPGPWKWPDADEGFDGDVVSVFENRRDAQEFAAEYGGTILTIGVPANYELSNVKYEDGYTGSLLFIRPLRNSEGYLAFTNGIPSQWIRTAWSRGVVKPTNGVVGTARPTLRKFGRHCLRGIQECW